MNSISKHFAFMDGRNEEARNLYSICGRGDLESLIHMKNRGVNLNIYWLSLLGISSTYGRLSILCYLHISGGTLYWLGALNASIRGHLEIVKYLVEHGISADCGHGRALMMAAENGHLPIVEYLYEHGARIRRKRVLLKASANGHLLMVKWLVEHGVNIHTYRDSALRYALNKEHYHVAKWLLNKGLNIRLKHVKNIRVARFLLKHIHCCIYNE